MTLYKSLADWQTHTHALSLCGKNRVKIFGMLSFFMPIPVSWNLT
jgi:hypothetical protein